LCSITLKIGMHIFTKKRINASLFVSVPFLQRRGNPSVVASCVLLPQYKQNEQLYPDRLHTLTETGFWIIVFCRNWLHIHNMDRYRRRNACFVLSLQRDRSV